MQEVEIIGPPLRATLLRNFRVFPVPRPAENHYFIVDEALSYGNRGNNCPPYSPETRTGPGDLPLFEGSWPEILDIFHRPASSQRSRIATTPWYLA